jgi:UDP-N-acetylglucosamine/UDP-N-acetylgalactosamine 4-epimerase
MELYSTKYHNVDISQYKFLITGGAGFIGSNIAEYLIKHKAGHVTVLDNLSNGYFENISKFINYENFTFLEGDITDYNTCDSAIKNADYVLHQAALGSVPRSIKDPLKSNDVNIKGHLNILESVKNNNNIKRLVYAASSSSYGDSNALPKVEGEEGHPVSPYAVTKLVNELYAEVYFRIHGLKSVGLRYFNVFGPNQNPNNPYAAVIPLFCNCFINNKVPIINGDGLTSRDFTFVENVVQANIKALFSNKIKKHEIINVACNSKVTLIEIIEILNKLSKKTIIPKHVEEREGDIKHSLAEIKKANNLIDYNPKFDFILGLEIVYNWYKKNKI